MKRIIPVIAVFLGIILFVPGLFFTGMYVSEAIVKTAESADRSLIFWYLPILFTGLAGLIGGTVLWLWAGIKLRDRKRTDQHKE